MSTNTKTDKTATTAAKPEFDGSPNLIQETKELNITLMVGQPNAGKSFLAGLLTDGGELIADKKFFLGDCEEGTNLVYSRFHTSRVVPIKIETEHDIEGLMTRMLEEGYDKSLLDLPGSSMRAVTRACGDFNDLLSVETKFYAVIVVGTREGSERVAFDWLKIMKHIDGIFWVWNNQNYEQKDERKLPKVADGKLPEELAGIDMNKITEIHIPALRSDIAREIITRGVSVSKVVAGLVPESTLLSHRAVKPKVARWRKEAYENLAPIFDKFKR